MRALLPDLIFRRPPCTGGRFDPRGRTRDPTRTAGPAGTGRGIGQPARRGRPAWTGVLIISLTAWSLEAAAAPEHPDVARFNRHPTARLAMRISDWYLAHDRVAKSMNWAERAAACKGATRSIVRKTQNRRAALRWPLHDRRYGLIDLHVVPSGARVEIDDQVMRPARAHYRVWLPAGSHHLGVMMQDHATIDRIISAGTGEDRRIDVALAITRPPALRPDIHPRDAVVWIDNVRVGHGRSRSIRSSAGQRLIEIKAPGYEPWVRTLTLRNGDIVPLVVILHKVVPDVRPPRLASVVKRRLNRYERARTGERGGLGLPGRVRDPARVTVERPGGGGSVPLPGGGARDEVPPATGADGEDKDEGKDGDLGGDEEDGPDEVGPAPEDRDEEGGEIDAVVEAGGGADDRSSREPLLRGWLIGGAGLAVTLGGVAWTLKNLQYAEYANSLRPGHKDYASFYGSVRSQTYAGYGVIAAGAVATGVGGYFLLGDRGPGRTGKGLFLAGCGAIAAGTGAYLIAHALAGVTEAARWPSYDPRRGAALDGLYATYDIGLYAAIGGGVVTLAGFYLAATGGTRSTADADAPGPASGLLQEVGITPLLGHRLSGATISLRW